MITEKMEVKIWN